MNKRLGTVILAGAILSAVGLHDSADAKSGGKVTSPIPPQSKSVVSLSLAADKWETVPWKTQTKWRWGEVTGTGADAQTIRSPIMQLTIGIPRGFGGASALKTKSDDVYLHFSAGNPGQLQVLSNGAYDAVAFSLKDPKGKTRQLRVVTQLKIEHPFFWVSDRCKDFGVGAGNRGITGDPKFLFSVLSCSETETALNVDIIRSADATFDSQSQLKPISTGSAPGLHWNRYAVSKESSNLYGAKEIEIFTIRRKGDSDEFEGVLYKSMDPYHRALTLFEFNHGEELPEAEKSLEEAQKLFDAGRFEEALPKLVATREADPELLQAWILEIRALWSLNRPTEAIAAENRFLASHPDFRDVPAFRKE